MVTHASPMNCFLKIKCETESDLDINKMVEELQAKGVLGVEVVPEEKVKIKMSEEEKQERKTRYSKEYRNRPDVIAEREKRKDDPEYQAQRKIYANLDHVVERKKVLNKARHDMFDAIKTRMPSLFQQLKKEFVPSKPRMPRAKRAKKIVEDVVEGTKKTLKRAANLAGLDDPRKGKESRKRVRV